jgi:hypothetical protein
LEIGVSKRPVGCGVTSQLEFDLGHATGHSYLHSTYRCLSVSCVPCLRGSRIIQHRTVFIPSPARIVHQVRSQRQRRADSTQKEGFHNSIVLTFVTKCLSCPMNACNGFSTDCHRSHRGICVGTRLNGFGVIHRSVPLGQGLRLFGLPMTPDLSHARKHEDHRNDVHPYTLWINSHFR